MAEPAPPPARNPPRLSGAQKSAILLLTLGEEAASAVLRHLTESEVRQVSGAIARVSAIPSEQASVVHEEAWRRLSGRDALPVDGERFARRVIRGAVASHGERDAHRDLQRLTQAGGEFLASSLESVPAPTLADVLADEHPQAIAVVLANLPARKAGEVLASLPDAVATDIVERIARLQTVPEDVLVAVGDVLHETVRGLGGAWRETGTAGARVAAAIMNVADPDVGERVFRRLDEHDPELAETIRESMMTFEDLVGLDDRDMQAVLKEVQRDDLMRALKTASPGMREKVFANLSQRTAEILADDMASMGPVRRDDVKVAEAAIVGLVRRLAAERWVTLRQAGDDAVG
ncbi:MAG TPA: flagellar motor switch protein FliG [Candidatus Binatia bacterium]|nr:flagellar motor switch protein FliG [Candidatus Binatia bacterium]